MAQTININVSGLTDTEITLDDVNAVENEKHLAQFFADGLNVFNKASVEMGGKENEFKPTADTDYVFTVTAEEANKLNGVANTYKHFLITEQADGGLGSTEPVNVLQNEGTVTVADLQEKFGAESSAVAYQNLNRERQSNVDTALTEDDDNVYGAPAVGVTITYTLPDNSTMVGKEITVHNDGAGDINVGAVVVPLSPGDRVTIRARAAGWDIKHLSQL